MHPGPALLLLLLTALSRLAAAEPPAGWSTASARAEIAPAFTYDPAGGPRGDGAFAISADAQPGRIGRWQRTFAVEGGTTYAFSALRRVHQADGRRAAVVRIHWQDTEGRAVRHDAPSPASYQPGQRPRPPPPAPGSSWSSAGPPTPASSGPR